MVWFLGRTSIPAQAAEARATALLAQVTRSRQTNPDLKIDGVFKSVPWSKPNADEYRLQTANAPKTNDAFEKIIKEIQKISVGMSFDILSRKIALIIIGLNIEI